MSDIEMIRETIWKKNMSEHKNIIESSIRLKEYHLIEKKRQEEIIEKLLQENTVDPHELETEVRRLVSNIYFIKYFELMSEGKFFEALQFNTNESDRKNIKKEIFRKYNIPLMKWEI
jgi:hypothetical protein